jgi:hypothetical protein
VTDKPEINPGQKSRSGKSRFAELRLFSHKRWQIADPTPKLVSDKAMLRLLLSCSGFQPLTVCSQGFERGSTRLRQGHVEAATLEEVVNFYNTRFTLHLPQEDGGDLVVFLKTR